MGTNPYALSNYANQSGFQYGIQGHGMISSLENRRDVAVVPFEEPCTNHSHNKLSLFAWTPTLTPVRDLLLQGPHRPKKTVQNQKLSASNKLAASNNHCPNNY